MSRIARAMLRDENLTASEMIAIHAMVTAVTRLGVPAKRILSHLMQMVPAASLTQLQKDFETIIAGMVEPEETHSQQGGHDEDDDRDVRRREEDEERTFDRVDPTGVP